MLSAPRSFCGGRVYPLACDFLEIVTLDTHTFFQPTPLAFCIVGLIVFWNLLHRNRATFFPFLGA